VMVFYKTVKRIELCAKLHHLFMSVKINWFIVKLVNSSKQRPLLFMHILFIV